ncbi:hypothetical protein BCV70DRAFT_51644 [Testicularia cyperi]|uniref:Homeobox domain-containing protein n=1 Tax=Testicularia cyperi TaxID=1882483 RepID=A0A317XWX5_9BASI|nr:hypothetical protein BCV70DRAFT_51644 [Testicularia cyperi]
MHASSPTMARINDWQARSQSSIHQQSILSPAARDDDQALRLPRHGSSRSSAISADEEDLVSLSDEDMLVCHNEDGWSDGLAIENGAGDSSNDGHRRSRQLLTAEQSKILFQILQKTHFPSTQVREDVAKQLGVSPRKVQVSFDCHPQSSALLCKPTTC